MKNLILLLCIFQICISCIKITPPSLTAKAEKSFYALTEKSELALSEYEISKIVRHNDTTIWQIFGDRKLLISCKVILKAGINLNKLDFKSWVINESNKTITIKLPNPEILSYNFPPEDINVAYEEVGILRSNFTESERLKILQIAENNLNAEIPSLGILDEAKKNAHNFFVPLFRTIGFEQVYITFESNKEIQKSREMNL